MADPYPVQLPKCPECGAWMVSGRSYDAGRIWALECKNGHVGLHRQLAEAPKYPKRLRRVMSQGFLDEVVRRHDALREEGMPPTATLAKERGVAPTTVKHWLRTAKARG